MKLGDKVKSKRTNKTYTLATYNDRYKNININYVKEHMSEFERRLYPNGTE